jgi:hypothetical protein
MTASPSLAARALLAVALMIGFYLLASAMAASMLYYRHVDMFRANGFEIKPSLVWVLSALGILWSGLNRPARA